MWDWDIDTDTVYLSDRWRTLFGFEDTYIQNYWSVWENKIHPKDRQRIMEILKDCQKNDNESFEVECRMQIANGEYIWVLAKGSILRDEKGKVIRMAGSYTNINDRKSYEANIYKMAYYDNLTNLPNRFLLGEQLIQVLKQIEKTGKKAAAYYIELDNFKHINDTLGHDFGDLLIKEVGIKLKATIQCNTFVARVGGDEYIVLVHDLDSTQEVISLADKLMSLFGKHWEVDKHEIFVSASIGITVMPDDGTDPQKIFKNADTAMYVAKASGKGNYKLFNEEMLQKVQMRIDMEKSMRKAIEKYEFKLYYQPYFSAKDGSLVGMEALIRWFHPKKGMISPARFIPLAEETGLIISIGTWVIEEACRQNKQWQTKGLSKVPVSVNISGLQLETKDFERNLVRILEDTQITPEYLQIEITESSIMESIDHNVEVLNRLRNLGIKILLDDFGTGYSSFSYLQKLPIDTIKIDKSFVNEINRIKEDSLLIGDIISIAHKLNMDVVAEGVETQEQFEYLKNNNCDKIQGFLLSKPLSAEEMEDLLKLV